MTRVELQYDLSKPLSDADYERLSELKSVYGVMGIRLRPDASGMTVEYDATRLNPDGVDHVLKRSGLPVLRVV
ncbi:hypothetical protein [Bryobacter aggregatus]|uniref:hypothetical protein n=1 Tax=Bryobacter aggregatus TaxID=360054 RepID=UPI0004E288B6|nr:hypothetical protein [Bryobacter aggregatus]